MTTTVARLAGAGRDEQPVAASGVYGAARRVIVGIDDTPSGQAALRWAVRRASADGARLVAVRAWALGLPRHGGRRHRHPDRSPVVFAFAGDSQRQAAIALVRRAFVGVVGVVPDEIGAAVEVSEGDPAVVLTQLAVADGDLLVLGDQDSPSMKRIVHGSVSRYCSTHSKCPVVIISSAGAEYDGPAKSAEIRPDQGHESSDEAQVRGAS